MEIVIKALMFTLGFAVGIICVLALGIIASFITDDGDESEVNDEAH